jgi:hypothetical protein
VSANIWHSCTNVTLDEAFAKAEPPVRAAFDRFVELVGRCEVIAQKTRIVIMAQVRFAGAQICRDRLLLNFALSRRVDDPMFRHESYGPRWIAHRFVVRGPGELDDPRLPAWLCEAYRDLGERGSLRRDG